MAIDEFIFGVQSLCGSEMLEYEENASLSDVSTFKIGGVCRIIIYPKSVYALRRIISSAKENSVNFAVFGRCSDVLFPDEGYEGALILTTKMKSVARKDNMIIAECGVLLGELSKFARFAGLSGAEFMYGIPGSVGGALVMNAGAYDHSVSEVVKKCTCLSLEDNTLVDYTVDEMELGYRDSLFMHNRKLIIIEAVFGFENGVPEDIQARMDDYMSRRRAKQPLGYPSAGSVFKRPAGNYAGKLIEDSGLKGKKYGGAMISPKHCGFIVNDGGARAEEVEYLIKLIQDTVYEKFGVMLETEIICFKDNCGE